MDAESAIELQQPSLLKKRPTCHVAKRKRTKSRTSKKQARRTLELRPSAPPAPVRAKSNNHLKVESINLRASSGRVVSTRRCTASTVAVAKPPEPEESPKNNAEQESLQSPAQEPSIPAQQMTAVRPTEITYTIPKKIILPPIRSLSFASSLFRPSSLDQSPIALEVLAMERSLTQSLCLE